MSDRELLEAAAKAAGLNYEHKLHGYYTDPEFNEVVWWEPLTDDGDALRLAVKLRLEINPTVLDKPTVSVYGNNNGRMVAAHEPRLPDIMAATRRAIVRAAAAMAPKEA